MVAPEYANILRQQGGTTVITSETGLVRVSVNCPYGLSLPKDSPLKGADFPNIFDDSMETRAYLAALLRKMGYDDDLITQATSIAPHEVGPGEFGFDSNAILNKLYEVPSVRKKHIKPFDDFHPQETGWIKTIREPTEPVDVYHAIMTSAHFTNDHNISFKIKQPRK